MSSWLCSELLHSLIYPLCNVSMSVTTWFTHVQINDEIIKGHKFTPFYCCDVTNGCSLQLIKVSEFCLFIKYYSSCANKSDQFFILMSVTWFTHVQINDEIIKGNKFTPFFFKCLLFTINKVLLYSVSL